MFSRDLQKSIVWRACLDRSMMKYIRFRDAGFVIFEQNQRHSDILRKFPGDEAVSAGNCASVLEDPEIHTFGESITIGRSAKEEDQELIRRVITSV